MEKARKIKHFKTSTGENHSLTISKETAERLSGCILYESFTADGVVFRSGCAVQEKQKRSYFVKL